jgi:phosphoglucomutase
MNATYTPLEFRLLNDWQRGFPLVAAPFAALAGEPVLAVLDRAPGNDAPIGGIKVVAERGWFAARPSGTEDICKIYAESFVGEAHLREILAQARSVVDAALRKAQ